MMLVGRRAADSRCLATIWFISSRPLGGTWWSTNCALDDVDFGVTVKASTEDGIPPRTPAAGKGAQLYDPLTTRQVSGAWTRDPIPGNILPANRIDPVAK